MKERFGFGKNRNVFLKKTFFQRLRGSIARGNPRLSQPLIVSWALLPCMGLSALAALRAGENSVFFLSAGCCKFWKARLAGGVVREVPEPFEQVRGSVRRAALPDLNAQADTNQSPMRSTLGLFGKQATAPLGLLSSPRPGALRLGPLPAYGRQRIFFKFPQQRSHAIGPRSNEFPAERSHLLPKSNYVRHLRHFSA